MGDTSRYRKYQQSQTVQHKRRIKVWGVDEDTNRYLRCWRCGFIIDTTKSLGNPDFTGIELLDAVTPHTNAPNLEGYNNAAYQQATLEFFDDFTAMKLATELQVPGMIAGLGLTAPLYTARQSIAVAGCPLCGLTNL